MSDVPQTQPQTKGGGTVLRGLGYFLIAVALLLLFYGGVAYWGWQSGQQLRQEQALASHQAELDKQVALTQGDIAAGNYELALLRLEWVANNGGQTIAADLQAEIGRQQALALTPSPTPTLIPSPTPTAEPVAAEEGDEVDDEAEAAEAFAELEALMADFLWSEAITAVSAFQQRWPSYRRPETNQMLYDAYLARGQRLLSGDDIERGLFYLEQARRLGPIPENVEGQIVFAELYLEGIVFYDVNWPAYLYYFRELCSYAPLFQEACPRLQDGLIKYGDALGVAQDWCVAAEHYVEARNLRNIPATAASETLAAKITTAREACLLATPTPLAGSEGGEEGEEGVEIEVTVEVTAEPEE
jgi:hypothetical protein